ncbi:MAG: signal peptide peptidase SppA [Gemella morbillorum]|jgi:signal peptide peptidase sppA, 36K type|uniref:Signal peptide peptidase SppA n=1 Tax=Gemella morbillorum TaxID=29391 RepID=A0AAP9KSK0_9BACL|nr:signal peptide peptidase SppA [Gemella morbillorum]EFV35179.1 signal peptide peptidase SppA [Gemella morbillorum M424]MBF1209242.1 signal peptide peptidase SppA [Gemella morbillorum]QGS08473.1 signal peptide peptidase SppA [Gemella morbillorum]
MNFKNKRVISLVIVMVLVVFSLINGTLTKSTIQKQSTEDSYVQMFLRSQSVHKLTLVDGNSDETIQKISIEGEIGAEMTNTYSRASIINQIKEAKSNSNVKAILLSVNTPGGGVYETAELYNELKNSGKDVYVSMKKQATSGGYYVSMAAKKIFANTETTTGSLGVIMSFVSAQKYLNDHGIKQETIRSGEQKAIGGLLEDLPESTRKIYQEQNKEAYDRFVKAIAQGRNMSEDEVRKLADGRTYTGTQAVENKLIDKIGTEEDLINFIKEDKKLFNPKVIELRPDKAAESLLSRFVKATMKSIISELNSEATSNQVERSYLG